MVGAHRILVSTRDCGYVLITHRLSETMDFIREKQRRRAEEKIAKPSTTLREARLLRAGTPRRTAPSTSLETSP
jgi:hypothetical protein